MAGRKDRYSPHLGSPRFERSPPLSSNWRNKVIRLAAESKSAIPPCVWEPGLLATVLYSEWNNLSAGEKTSWESCPNLPQCSPKARFIQTNLAEFVANYRLSKAWPLTANDQIPIGETSNMTGAFRKIDAEWECVAEFSGWLWTYHRDLDNWQPPSLSNMYLAALFDGSLVYSWTDHSVAAGTWKTRLVLITAKGLTNEGALTDTAVVT